MSDDTANLKRALRAELRERRRNLTQSARDSATESLTAHLIELAQSLEVRSVAAFLSATDEPNVRPFLNWMGAQGVRILFPISRADGLLDWSVGDGESETTGLFGMPEPVGEILGPLAINEVDLIVVPAASVDRSGMRLGWGRGYFDRTLGSMAGRPPVFAVVYDNELIDELPHERHDQPVDGVVTPAGIVRFTPAS